MAKSLYCSDIKPGGDVIREWFLLRDKQVRQTRQGKAYLSLVLADRTGTVEAKAWDIAETPAKMGDLVKIEATVGTYQDQVQLTVSRLRLPLLTDDVPGLECFYLASQRDRDVMLAELDAVVASVGDIDLRILLTSAIAEVRDKLRDAPAARAFHHAYIGGLLEHILSMSEAALALRSHYTFDLDLVTAGCILHDIGKCWELSNLGEYTVEGRLQGHVVAGYLFVAKLGERLRTDSRVLSPLLHLIASHHGQIEYGAPVTPATVEALILHAIDKLDANLASVAAAMAMDSDDEFTPFIPALKSRFVRLSPRVDTAANEPKAAAEEVPV